MTALWLLMPETPLFFQGQEFAASTPFCYFLDNPPERAAEVAAGRAKFLRAVSARWRCPRCSVGWPIRPTR